MRVVFVFLLVFASQCFSFEDLKVVTENHPPVQFEVDGEVKGYATEILHEILGKAKLSASIESLPWARAYNRALNEKNTLIYSMLRTENREDKFHWIGPISQLNVGVLAHRERTDINPSNLEEAKKFIFGTIRDSYAHTYLVEQGFSEDSNLFLAATTHEQVDLFVKKRVDLLLTDPIAIRHRFKEKSYPVENIKVLFWVPDLTKDLYLAAGKKTDMFLVDELTEAMNDFRRTDHYQSLYDLKSMLEN